MEIVRTLTDSKEPQAVALGFFDGLHLGHRAVIDAVLEEKKNHKLASVITFSEHPAKVLGGADVPLLTTNEEKLRILEQWGVDRVYMLDFAAIADMPPEEFVREILQKRLQAGSVSCGYNFRFGKGGAGDGDMLKEMLRETAVRVKVLEPVQTDGEIVCSTAIRELLNRGDAAKAARFLGRPFSYAFPVVHGKHLGTLLGTPTLNQHFPEDFVKPKFGVYAARCLVDGKWYEGVANVGVKPTVGSDKVLSETWLFDFHGDLYGATIRTELVEFIRPEKKFDGLPQLKEAILRDRETATRILSKKI